MTQFLVRSVYRVITGRDDLGDRLVLDTAGTADARAAAERYSRGNVAIQDGSFVTTGDLERERERNARHSFPD